MESTDMRDSLALERTRLANERTLLSYVRTSLSMLAGGAVLLQFFHPAVWVIVVAWSLMLAGGSILGLGLYRFTRVKSRLRNW